MNDPSLIAGVITAALQNPSVAQHIATMLTRSLAGQSVDGDAFGGVEALERKHREFEKELSDKTVFMVRMREELDVQLRRVEELESQVAALTDALEQDRDLGSTSNEASPQASQRSSLPAGMEGIYESVPTFTIRKNTQSTVKFSFTPRDRQRVEVFLRISSDRYHGHVSVGGRSWMSFGKKRGKQHTIQLDIDYLDPESMSTLTLTIYDATHTARLLYPDGREHEVYIEGLARRVTRRSS